MTAHALDNKRKTILIDEHQSGLEGNYFNVYLLFWNSSINFHWFSWEDFFKNTLEKRLLFMNIKLFKQFVNNC